MSLSFQEKRLLVVGMLLYRSLKILSYFSPLTFHSITLPVFLVLLKAVLTESNLYEYGVLVLQRFLSLQMGFLECLSIWWSPVRVNLQVCYVSLILIVLWNPLFSVGFQQRVLTNDLGPNSALRCRRVILTDSGGTSMSISENTILFFGCEIIAQTDKRISCTFILVTPSIQERDANPPAFLVAQFVLFLVDHPNSSAVTWVYIFYIVLSSEVCCCGASVKLVTLKRMFL